MNISCLQKMNLQMHIFQYDDVINRTHHFIDSYLVKYKVSNTVPFVEITVVLIVEALDVVAVKAMKIKK